MLELFSKVKKPDYPCKIDIALTETEHKTLDKLKGPSNKDLIFKEDKVYHKKYGYIGTIPKKKYDRFIKLNNYEYFWAVYNINDSTETDDGFVDVNKGKGFSLKIYNI